MTVRRVAAAIVAGAFAAAWAVTAADASSSPSPAPVGVLALPQDVTSPLPLPTPLPSILPGGGGPSPAASPSPKAKSGGSTGQTGSGGGGFSSSGIGGAFIPGTTDASAAGPTPAPQPSPQQNQQSVAPPFLSNPGFLFPDRGGATPNPVLPLLVGLLLVSVGLALMAMRHRREALQAAGLERTKTDFLNLASHELRGPLTVLKGYMSTAEEGVFGALPKELKHRMPIVLAQLDRIDLLVEQMLETARLEAGNPDVKREPGDLREVVKGALPTERLEGSEHEVSVEVPDLPVVVDMDAARLGQVIHNLMDNAIKYSDAPARVWVKVTAEGRQAVVTVTDQGHGMPKERMQRLFTRFGRLVTDRDSDVPGVGLGLYLGRSVARMHGGDLVADSEAGRGSTFTLTLPLYEEGAATEPQLKDRLARFAARWLPSKARESAS